MYQVIDVKIDIRPKKNKRFVCPFGLKIRRVGRSIFFFFFNVDADEIQYYLCIWILGHAESQNWFDPGVGRDHFPLYLVKIPFWDSYYIFWHFFEHFCLKIQNWISKKKQKQTNKQKKRPLFSDILGRRKRTNKHLFLGLTAKTKKGYVYLKGERGNTFWSHTI